MEKLALTLTLVNAASSLVTLTIDLQASFLAGLFGMFHFAILLLCTGVRNG
ncbi:hypothetical protein VXS72_15785 [Acinetobacter pittii]|uniref:hypothetical protein n=1 Tax=Acinetobacter pittii TaxID=48296 RepID=UPI002E184CDA|nr:hypothetical protein [Acinetobacter pittii]